MKTGKTEFCFCPFLARSIFSRPCSYCVCPVFPVIPVFIVIPKNTPQGGSGKQCQFFRCFYPPTPTANTTPLLRNQQAEGNAEHQAGAVFLDALLDGPVTDEQAKRIGIRRLSRRIGELRHLEGIEIEIENVRGPLGSQTIYRLGAEGGVL